MKKIAILFTACLTFGAAHATNAVLRDTHACADRSLFDRIVQAAATNDTDGFMRLLGTALADGKCVMLWKGEQVQVVDYELLKGVKRVQRQGQRARYWTYSEAVR